MGPNRGGRSRSRARSAPDVRLERGRAGGRQHGKLRAAATYPSSLVVLLQRGRPRCVNCQGPRRRRQRHRGNAHLARRPRRGLRGSPACCLRALPARKPDSWRPSMSDTGDPYHLQRFVAAQADHYREALSEIRDGRKRSHWMWYVFPQYAGLGSSPTSRHYAIKSLREAEAYLRHPLLGARLLESCEAVLAIDGRSAFDVFGSPDDLKLHSSATLFAHVSPPDSVFERILDRYFDGKPDEKTLALLSITRDDM